jgi:hypothetical protein
MFHEWFRHGSIWDNARTSECGPPPGFLTGGPNANYTGSLSPPAGQPRQKAYRDWNTGWPENSWEITEPGIYYQAAYVKLLSAFRGPFFRQALGVTGVSRPTHQSSGRLRAVSGLPAFGGGAPTPGE